MYTKNIIYIKFFTIINFGALKHIHVGYSSIYNTCKKIYSKYQKILIEICTRFVWKSMIYFFQVDNFEVIDQCRTCFLFACQNFIQLKIFGLFQMFLVKYVMKLGYKNIKRAMIFNQWFLLLKGNYYDLTAPVVQLCEYFWLFPVFKSQNSTSWLPFRNC